MRLEALKSYMILDTESEILFDDITELASELCSTPIALVSLIDSERQWFKSKVGLKASETARDISFCGHAIHQSEIFEVTDSSKNKDFSDNPLVTGEPKVMFYAGAPLVDEDGFSLGTLCVIDHSPRKLTEKQKSILSKLAKQVVSQFHLRRKNLELIQSIKENELAQEKLIQSSKLASLGEMAAGMAHEINNPLSIIIGYANSLECLAERKKTVASNIVLSNCSEIEKTSFRISDIINALKRYSRNSIDDSHSESVSFSQILDDTLALCQEKFKSKGVDLIVSDLASGQYISCRPIEISQVLINLLNNSSDAVAGSAQAWIKIEHKIEGDEHIIAVSNSGQFVDPSIVKYIFDPFFTTKEVGKGTGLGLSISMGLIKAHGGEIFYCTDSPFSTFVIKLPKKLE